jgi:beta-lactamase regulating signal transducer with metallopeptidase domain
MTAAIAWLWQGLLLVAVLDLLLRAVPRLNAATRHLAWWGALVGLLLLGVVHGTGQAVGSLAPLARSSVAASAEPSLSLVVLPPAPDWLLPLAVAAWAALAVRGTVAVWRGFRRVERLRRAAMPIEAGSSARLRRWKAADRRRAAPVWVTLESIGACALGFRRPAILVSRHLLDSLDEEALDLIVLHEQAHLDRYDDWLRVTQALVTALLAVHPAAHLIGRRLDLEREAACDDRVVSATGGAERYAACLTEAAAQIAGRLPIGVPTVAGTRRSSAGSLRARVVRLLDTEADRGRLLMRPVLVAAALSIVAILAAAPLMPSLIVFVENAAPPGGVRTARLIAAPDAAPDRTVPGSQVPSLGPARVPDDRQPARRRAVRSEPTTPASSETVAPRADAPQSVPVVAATREPESEIPAEAHDVRSTNVHEVPAEVLGSAIAMLDAPPVHEAATASQGATSPVAANRSFLGSMSQLGLGSAATARRAGVSVASTFARAGKAVGRIF